MGKRWRGRRWSGGEREKRQPAREGGREKERGKKKARSATQSRSHRGEEGLLVHDSARVLLAGKTAPAVMEERAADS